jgi:glycine dehydrogenase subunit 1
MTSYTPYQAEISQGLLQVLFEYQSLICDLTDMELANASLYDGATSVAEAISVAINKTKRDNVVISSGFNPNTKEVVNTLIDNKKFNINYVDLVDYLFPEDYVFSQDDAAFVISLPHYEGSAQDLTSIVQNAKAAGVITICYADPSMLGILKSPGSMGFDIVVSEGQSMGSSLSFGGPTVGWFATRKELARLVPGRIIGESRDSNNTKTYVMTLRAREQDIRREKASSNICTNQTLNAVGSTIHLSWLGPQGLYEIGYQAIQKASYMKQALIKNGFNVLNNSTSLREFLIQTKRLSEDIILEMGDKGYLAGIKYSENEILVAVTEKRTKEQIDNYVQSLMEVDNA